MTTLQSVQEKNDIYLRGVKSTRIKPKSDVIIQNFFTEINKVDKVDTLNWRASIPRFLRVTMTATPLEEKLITALTNWVANIHVGRLGRTIGPLDPAGIQLTTADFITKLKGGNIGLQTNQATSDLILAYTELVSAENAKLYKSIGSISEPIIDDNAFIQLVAQGFIPLDDEPVTAARAFMCAKCVYQSYLANDYQQRLKKISKKIAEEENALNAKNRTFIAANLDVETKASILLRILVAKQGIIQRNLNIINKEYREFVDNGSLYATPFALFQYISSTEIAPTSSVDSAGNAIEYTKHKIVLRPSSRETPEIAQKYIVNMDGQPNLTMTNLTDRYTKIVTADDSLIFTAEEINKTQYELAYGAKQMIDAGVDDEIRFKFYRMATSFAIAPFTMFDTMAMNIALMGPPGTGKSTLAKKIGNFAHAVGWLTSSDVEEPKPSDLISNIRGETAHRTRAFLDASLGKMCFIDEAYALTPKNDAAGKEFADELTEFLTNHKGMLMVMVAGYENEMKQQFFSSNIGLARRFPTRIILGVKTPMMLFNAFMTKITEKIGVIPVGALNIEQFTDSQIPFFITQASIWLPIFNILLGKRQAPNNPTQSAPDDLINLLNFYFADIELIAEIYCRYLMTEGLFHKGSNDEIQAGDINRVAPFKISAILHHVLNDWLLTKTGGTEVENVLITGSNGPSTVLDMALAEENGLDIYKAYLDDPTTNISAAFVKARELLENGICLWPAKNTDDTPVLFCPNTSITITFKPRDNDAKVPFSAKWSWITDQQQLQTRTSSETHINPNTMEEAIMELQVQQANARRLQQYVKDEQKARDALITHISESHDKVSDEDLQLVEKNTKELQDLAKKLIGNLQQVKSSESSERKSQATIVALNASIQSLKQCNDILIAEKSQKEKKEKIQQLLSAHFSQFHLAKAPTTKAPTTLKKASAPTTTATKAPTTKAPKTTTAPTLIF